jgi:hypothetical protein
VSVVASAWLPSCEPSVAASFFEPPPLEQAASESETKTANRERVLDVMGTVLYRCGKSSLSK